MKIAQINSVLNTGSTGRIAEQIGELAIARGHDSFIAYGRRAQASASRSYRIGNSLNILSHGLESLLLDRHGLSSRNATGRLIERLVIEKPDVISLHNIHGYFLNFPVLFEYIKKSKIPVVWTLHDCWAFTGHCSYFDRSNCTKWQAECFACPLTRDYPKSFTDFSKRNFRLKKHHFGGVEQMTIITPSEWLGRLVSQSFLSEYPTKVIRNGVDVNVFRPTKSDSNRQKLVLGVASIWSDRKGLRDFIQLRKILPAQFEITIVGVSNAQRKALPSNIKGVCRTESIGKLVSLYQDATVFVNPTYSDNFPTTNIESLSCGTPVVTYDTGGSPEAIDESTGRVVAKGDISGMARAICDIAKENQAAMSARCRLRAEQLFDQTDRFSDHVNLLEAIHERSIQRC